MKHIASLLAALVCCLSVFAAEEKPEKPWRYVNGEQLRIINKGFNDTERTYSRLPLPGAGEGAAGEHPDRQAGCQPRVLRHGLHLPST